MYNTTNLSLSNSPTDIIVWANDNTQGVLFGGFVIALWFVFFLILKKYSFERAFVTSSFLCFLISIFFVNSGFVTFHYLIVFGVMTLFSGFWIYLDPNY